MSSHLSTLRRHFRFVNITSSSAITVVMLSHLPSPRRQTNRRVILALSEVSAKHCRHQSGQRAPLTIYGDIAFSDIDFTAVMIWLVKQSNST